MKIELRLRVQNIRRRRTGASRRFIFSWIYFVFYLSLQFLTNFFIYFAVSQSEQEKSCILLLRLQTRTGGWVWVHCVMQVKENLDGLPHVQQQSQHQSAIVLTNQVLTWVQKSTISLTAKLKQSIELQRMVKFSGRVFWVGGNLVAQIAIAARCLYVGFNASTCNMGRRFTKHRFLLSIFLCLFQFRLFFLNFILNEETWKMRNRELLVPIWFSYTPS